VRPTKAVLKALLSAPKRTLDKDALISAVADRGVTPTGVEKAVASLKASGRLIEIEPGIYQGLKDRDLAVGRLSMTRKGYGFVELQGGDIYVRATDMRGALHRDVVAVRVFSERGGKRSGEVAYVVERANETIVGRFEKHGVVGVVVPSDRRIQTEVLISPDGISDAANGDMVVAKVTRFPTSRDAAQGFVQENLGHEGEPGVDIEVIIREHGLRTAFPGSALDEAATIPIDNEASSTGRTDLRDLFTVTIDPPDAKDFDDAISLEWVEGVLRLWVHIADVSHYVPWGSEIDREAVKRANSVYLVDRVLPMLPERLSNVVCSLKPDEDRLTMTAEIDIDRQGVVSRYRLYPSLIRSDQRLDYESVDEWLDDDSGFPDDKTAQLLRDFASLGKTLDRRRVSRGGLDLETVEAKVILSDEGIPIDVKIRQRTPATCMIEQGMILANEVVAQHMVSHEAPMVFRIHEDPDPDALKDIAVVLREFDYPIGNVADAKPRTFQKIIEHAHKRPEKLLINSLLLRTLKRARYVDFQHSHFGLASEAYTHFTSPIRRYPDLIVHRLLKAQLAGTLGDAGTSEMIPELGWLAEHCSEQEREAEAAENDSVKLKLTQLMAEHVGEMFDGIVTSVMGFGMFVQLPNTAEGLVHVENMTDDYYQHDAERFMLYGETRGRTYRLGQQVKVRVIDVIVSESRIDLELA